MDTSGLSCKACERTIHGAALACVACGALHHEGCHRAAGHCAACTCGKPAVAVSVGGCERSRTLALLAAGLAIVGFAAALAVQARWPSRFDSGLAEVVRVREVVRVEAPASFTLTSPFQPAGSDRVAGHWTGTIAGNDPRVTADVALQQVGREVMGLLVWTSRNSGRSHREVRGYYDPDRRMVMLRDVGMPVAQASGNWRFCPVDYYLLELKGDELSGTYWSTACADRARVALRRAP
jgi:hypothetical protein